MCVCATTVLNVAILAVLNVAILARANSGGAEDQETRKDSFKGVSFSPSVSVLRFDMEDGHIQDVSTEQTQDQSETFLGQGSEGLEDIDPEPPVRNTQKYFGAQVAEGGHTNGFARPHLDSLVLLHQRANVAQSPSSPFNGSPRCFSPSDSDNLKVAPHTPSDHGSPSWS